MLLPPLTKLLPFASLVATVTAAPVPASTIDNAAVQSCETEFARCLRLRMNIDHCHEAVCNKYNNELTEYQCKPCQDNGLPTIYDRAVTPLTSDNTAGEAQALNGRAGAKPFENYCIVICTHAHCGLLCTNPGGPLSGAMDDTETAADTGTTDLLDIANARPDQLGVPLVDGMTTVIATLDEDHQLEENCMWVCSGKVNCRKVCCDSIAPAQCSLIKDIGTLPENEAVEGEAVEGMGKCEIVKKNKVVQIMVCQVPEAAGGDALTAGNLDPNGMRCLILWIGVMPQIVCHKVPT
ncbi:hypothetical protein N0V86_000068 [Didymella sp. IMI 355093]|nr:hypothetical protein N0V86_000068 [Didymella sp. IMI 355093]